MSVLRFLGYGTAIPVALTFATLGCSDPSAPIPQGAFNVTFGDAVGTGVACPAKKPAQLQVGAVNSGQVAPVADGEDGARVSCQVKKTSVGFHINGTISKGLAEMLVTTDAFPGSTSEGKVSVKGANTAAKHYGPATGSPCEFQVIQAEEGRAWLSFSCPHLNTGSSESEQCSLYSSFLFLDNCDS